MPSSTFATEGTVQVAVTHSQYGDAAAVLSLDPAWPRGSPSPTQVTIKVIAAGMNPADVRIVEGSFHQFFSLPFPYVPGFDCAGVVVAKGSAVTCFQCGDAVYACCPFHTAGAFRQYVEVEESLVSLKPANMTFVETAALPVAASTSLMAMEKAGVTVGSRVLIIGASGGCGSYAVQIARAMGAAYIVGVTSTKNLDFVTGLGADRVIDYTQMSMKDSGLRDLDFVFDTVGGHWKESAPLLREQGKFISTAFWEAPPASSQYQSIVLSPSHTHLDRIRTLIEKKAMLTTIDREFPFTIEGVHSMYAYCKTGRTRGKAVLIIDPNFAI